MSRGYDDIGWPDEDEDHVGWPDEDDQAPAGGHRGNSRSAKVGGSADGPVVAGDFNIVVNARDGSTVNVGRAERPAPVRRNRISVVPRRMREPLGREADAARLAAAIAAGGLVQLCGPDGIGKSTLLRHLARTAENGPDGVVFVNATHKQVTDLAQEVFEACYRTSGYAPSRTDLRGMLAGLRITVYLDDPDLTIDELRELTDLVPDATFVIACRDSTLLGDAVVHNLDGLGQDTATRLLTQALGRPLHEVEHTTASDLWRVSGGNPLLLLRAAGIAGSTQSTLPAPGAVGDLLPQLLQQLDNLAMNALNVLATLQDAELAPEHIGALAHEPDPAALCDRLTDLGLMTPGEHGYQCAPGVASAVRHRAPAAIPIERMCQHFTRWAADPATTPAQVAAHSRAIEQVAGLTTNAGMPELTVALARAASPKLAHSLRFDTWGRTLSQGWTGARRADDQKAEAYFTHEEGIRCLVTNQRVVAAALLGQAFVLWNVVGDYQGETAASDAHQYLPHELQPPGPIGTPPQAGEIDTSQVVADHMAALDHMTPDPPPITFDSFDTGHYSTEIPSFEGPPDQNPPQPHSNPTTAPDSSNHSVPANATSPEPFSSAAGATTTSGTTAAAVAQGSSLATTIFVTLAIGAVALIVYNNKNKEDDAADTSTPQTGIVGTWEGNQDTFTIVESGPGEYFIRTACDSTVELTGNDTEATGEMPTRKRGAGNCGPIIGYDTITITVGVNPDTAQWTVTISPDEAGMRTCNACGTSTLTRVG